MGRERFPLLAGLVVLAATMTATAQYNRQYFASVIGTGNQMAGGKVYIRYYAPGYSTVSPSGSTVTCPTSLKGATVSFEAALRACELRFLPVGAGGYKGYEENIFKDKLNGAEHYALFDLQTGAGTRYHIGYYFWARRAVNNVGDPLSIWNGTDCAGTAASTCLGQGTTTTSTGYSLQYTPLGPINPLGGLRPIPVPRVVSAHRFPDPSPDAAIDLVWQREIRGWSLDGGGAGAEFPGAKYQITGLSRMPSPVGGYYRCEPPTEFDYDAPAAGDVRVVYPVQTTTSLTVHVSDFGRTKNDPWCYYFALKGVFNDADFNPPLTTLYYSANGTCVVFGGLASGITDASATIAKGRIVTIRWTTTLSECVQGYNVLRSFSQAGPFITVNRTMIPDRHGPASYSYIDVLKTPEKSLWYVIEAISCDQGVERTPAFPATRK